jgi:trigger factor
VEFRVIIKNVLERSLPELNDEFSVAFGAKTLEELKTLIRTDIEKHKSFEAEKKTELNILEKILALAKFGDLPEILINNESEKMLVELEENVSRQGGKMEDYLTAIKKTKEQLVLDLLPEALKRVKTALLIKKIAETEKVEVSKKEIEAKQEELLKQYAGYAKVEERVKNPSYKIYLHNSLTNQKTIEKLKEWNVKK